MTRFVRSHGILPRCLAGIMAFTLQIGVAVHGASTDTKPEDTSHAAPAATNTPAGTTSSSSKTIVISSPDDAIKAAQDAMAAITNAADDDGPKGKPHESTVLINVDHGDKKGNSSLMEAFMDSLIPLFGILASFGTPVLIVFFVFYFRYRRRQDNIALAREFLAKGLPVPPELLGGGNSSSIVSNSPPLSRSRYDIRKGVLWTFIGLGVSVAMYVNDPHDSSWGWGLIPMIIGLGFLTAGWLDQRTNGKDGSS